MPERLVDVDRQGAEVLHTFPVSISASAVEEEAYKQKALEAAANAKLVPNEELEKLNAKDSAATTVEVTEASAGTFGPPCEATNFIAPMKQAA